MTTTTPAPEPPVLIRRAGTADTDAFIDLVSLIDLHRPDVDTAFEPLRLALAEPPTGPLSHRFNHFLIAETPDHLPVGAIACGTPLWVYEHRDVPSFMRGMLRQRISCVHMLAVRPDFRRRGIGRALLRQAENDLTEAGITVLTLRHEPGLEAYYTPLGYTSMPRLVMDLPPLRPVSNVQSEWRFAVKPLAPGVGFTTVYGQPVRVVTGVLTAPPGCGRQGPAPGAVAETARPRRP